MPKAYGGSVDSLMAAELAIDRQQRAGVSEGLSRMQQASALINQRRMQQYEMQRQADNDRFTKEMQVQAAALDARRVEETSKLREAQMEATKLYREEQIDARKKTEERLQREQEAERKNEDLKRIATQEAGVLSTIERGLKSGTLDVKSGEDLLEFVTTPEIKARGEALLSEITAQRKERVDAVGATADLINEQLAPLIKEVTDKQIAASEAGWWSKDSAARSLKSAQENLALTRMGLITKQRGMAHLLRADPKTGLVNPTITYDDADAMTSSEKPKDKRGGAASFDKSQFDPEDMLVAQRAILVNRKSGGSPAENYSVAFSAVNHSRSVRGLPPIKATGSKVNLSQMKEPEMLTTDEGPKTKAPAPEMSDLDLGGPLAIPYAGDDNPQSMDALSALLGTQSSAAQSIAPKLMLPGMSPQTAASIASLLSQSGVQAPAPDFGDLGVGQPMTVTYGSEVDAMSVPQY